MTFNGQRKITFNEARNILAIMFYGTEVGKKINRVLCDVDENPWQIGEPAEEGWYLVAYECVHECKNKGKLEYHTMHIFEDELGYKDIRGMASDDVWKAVAWQKITPYEEKKNG